MKNPITPIDQRRSVLQDWVHELTFMQQSVLIACVRGPDGIRKDHPVKVLVRWLRRCFLISAFNRCALLTPYDRGGGSFTGPSIQTSDLDDTADVEWFDGMKSKGEDYFRYTDEIPHHFTLHLMHAAEILGYKHPDPSIRGWWNWFYLSCANDMHLFPETEQQMDERLGDFEAQWRAREVVTAK